MSPEDEFGRAVVWREEGPFVYIRCPHCGESLEEPFARFIPIRPFDHYSPGGKQGGEVCRARFVVLPDPMGSDHRVRVLGHNDSKEEVLQALGSRAQVFHRSLSAIYRMNLQMRLDLVV